MAQYLEVTQLLLFPDAARRRPPIRRVIISDTWAAQILSETLPPFFYSRATALLPRPVEEPLRQLGIVDTRSLRGVTRERDMLLDWGRTVAARVRADGGDEGLGDWLKLVDRRVKWLEDQIRRKRAAIDNGLLVA